MGGTKGRASVCRAWTSLWVLQMALQPGRAGGTSWLQGTKDSGALLRDANQQGKGWGSTRTQKIQHEGLWEETALGLGPGSLFCDSVSLPAPAPADSPDQQ